MLKLKDLKEKGLQLSQFEAQEIHSKINGISLGHFADGIVYEGTGKVEKTESDPLKQYYSELQEKHTELLKEIDELKGENKELAYQLEQSKVINVDGQSEDNKDSQNEDIEEAQDENKPDETAKKKGGRPAKANA